MFRGDESRQRRGYDAVESHAAGTEAPSTATWIFRGVARLGYRGAEYRDMDIPWSRTGTAALSATTRMFGGVARGAERTLEIAGPCREDDAPPK